MNSEEKYVVEFALRTLVRFLYLEEIDVSEIVDKHSSKVLGNELGFDDGLGPKDKIKALELIKSSKETL